MTVSCLPRACEACFSPSPRVARWSLLPRAQRVGHQTWWSARCGTPIAAAQWLARTRTRTRTRTLSRISRISRQDSSQDPHVLVAPAPAPVPAPVTLRRSHPMRFPRLTRAARTARYLKALLHTHQQQVEQLTSLADSLNGIGRLLAQVHGEPWADKRTRSRDQADQPQEDRSGVAAPDDQWFADLEAAQQDYWVRFGRELSAEEAMTVVEEHRAAVRGRSEA